MNKQIFRKNSITMADKTIRLGHAYKSLLLLAMNSGWHSRVDRSETIAVAAFSEGVKDC